MGRFDDVRALAARQHGTLTLAQFRRAGISARQVERACEEGHLRRLHRGVYLFGSFPQAYTPEAAAVLACGPGAVLSHRSAAALLGLLASQSRPVHVTVARHLAGQEGIVVHRSRPLLSWEVRERHRLPLTAPVRALVDLAATATTDELQEAVAEAFSLRLTNLAALRSGLTRYRGRRGVTRLSAVLQEGGPRRTRSAPERILLSAIRKASLPIPETNVRIGGWEVDFLWRKAGLVVEVDVYSTHSSPFAFERDRRKDADLRARGLAVQRFTGGRIATAIDEVVAWIDGALRSTAD